MSGKFSPSLITFAIIIKKYIIYIAVLPMTERRVLKMGKHLNLSQRIIIESKLNENISLRKIGEMLGKPHTTISREILGRRILIKGNHFNNFNTKCDKTNKAPFVCNSCPTEL